MVTQHDVGELKRFCRNTTELRDMWDSRILISSETIVQKDTLRESHEPNAND